MVKKVKVLKLVADEHTGDFLKGQVFGENEAEFLGYSFTKEVEDSGEFNHYIGVYYGDYVYAVFDREVEGLSDDEIEYLMDALIGINFYAIREYEALEINGTYVPLELTDSCCGFYIKDEQDLEHAITHFTDNAADVILAVDSRDMYLNDIYEYSEKLGINDILEVERIDVFKKR